MVPKSCYCVCFLLRIRGVYPEVCGAWGCNNRRLQHGEIGLAYKMPDIYIYICRYVNFSNDRVIWVMLQASTCVLKEGV